MGGGIAGPVQQLFRAGGGLSVGSDGTSTWLEKPVDMPGCDSTDRSARGSNGYQSWSGPGYSTGSVEMRKQIGVFDNNFTAGTVNTCMIEGGNLEIGAQKIDPSRGGVGWGYENSYNPSSTTVQTEQHLRHVPAVDSAERRTFSSSCINGTGETTMFIGAGTVNLYHFANDGTSTQMITWASNSAVAFPKPGHCSTTDNPPFLQLNHAQSAFIPMGYWNSSNQYVLGEDYSLGSTWRPVKMVQHYMPPAAFSDVPTPADGAIFYWDSAAGKPLWKLSNGSAVDYAGSVVH
jgi:hypothetical protein